MPLKSHCYERKPKTAKLSHPAKTRDKIRQNPNPAKSDTRQTAVKAPEAGSLRRGVFPFEALRVQIQNADADADAGTNTDAKSAKSQAQAAANTKNSKTDIGKTSISKR